MDLLKSAKRKLGNLIFVSAVLSTLTACGLLFSSQPRYSTYDRLVQHGPSARRRWLPHFSRAGLSYPPVRIILVAFKAEKVLQVYAGDEELSWLTDFPICAASGSMGPKLREGDRQVPEGIYSIPYLIPNSRFHLSLRVNYPNDFDRSMAQLDGRSRLGGEIALHGNCRSQGCLAIGDLAVEDLFVLAADTGVKNIKLIIAPYDLRKYPVQPKVFEGLPAWTPFLYSLIDAELHQLPGHP